MNGTSIASALQLQAANVGQRRDEARYRGLAENSSVGIWHIDTAGHTVYANPTMCRMLEVETAAELAGHAFHRYFTQESLQRMANEHAQCSSGVTSSYEVELVGSRGTRRAVLISGAPLNDETGDLDGLIGTFVDMTKHRELEAELRQLKKMESIGQLAAGVAHDFNKLLTVIQGHLQLLSDEALDARCQESVESALGTTKRAEILTRQLLLFSRKQPVRLQRLDLGAA